MQKFLNSPAEGMRLGRDGNCGCDVVSLVDCSTENISCCYYFANTKKDIQIAAGSLADILHTVPHISEGSHVHKIRVVHANCIYLVSQIC